MSVLLDCAAFLTAYSSLPAVIQYWNWQASFRQSSAGEDQWQRPLALHQCPIYASVFF